MSALCKCEAEPHKFMCDFREPLFYFSSLGLVDPTVEWSYGCYKVKWLHQILAVLLTGSVDSLFIEAR